MMDGLLNALRNGQQCDEDGVMCVVSRQACHEAADMLERLRPMSLIWDEIKPSMAWRAPAPLFGSVRVERYDANGRWEVNWSVPGFCDTLVPGEWETAAEAKRVAEDHVRSACLLHTKEPK